MGGTTEIAGTTGVNTTQGIVEQVQDGTESVYTRLVTDVPDGDTAFDVAISRLGSVRRPVAIIPTFTTGGAAHLSLGVDVEIADAGTPLPTVSKLVNNGETLEVTVADGGTYTTNGPTTEVLLPGTQAAGGVARSGNTVASGTLVLNPGESLRYTLTNRSGTAVDFSVEFTVVEVNANTDS